MRSTVFVSNSSMQIYDSARHHTSEQRGSARCPVQQLATERQCAAEVVRICCLEGPFIARMVLNSPGQEPLICTASALGSMAFQGLAD